MHRGRSKDDAVSCAARAFIDPDGHLLGIVSQADLARAARLEGDVDGDDLATVVEVISELREA